MIVETPRTGTAGVIVDDVEEVLTVDEASQLEAVAHVAGRRRLRRGDRQGRRLRLVVLLNPDETIFDTGVDLAGRRV